MSFDLSTNEEEHFIRLQVRGQKMSSNLLDAWRHMLNPSQQTQLKPILIEDHMDGTRSPAQLIELEDVLRRWRFPRELKIAIADLRREKDYNDVQLGETLAVNRGWNNIRAFATVDEAEAWLGLKSEEKS